jgi:hypothetical protein
LLEQEISHLDLKLEKEIVGGLKGGVTATMIEEDTSFQLVEKMI